MSAGPATVTQLSSSAKNRSFIGTISSVIFPHHGPDDFQNVKPCNDNAVLYIWRANRTGRLLEITAKVK